MRVSIGKGIGWITCRRHTHERVAYRCGAAADRSAEPVGLEIRHIRRHCKTDFFLGLLFVNRETFLAGQPNSHRGKRIAVAGDAPAVSESRLTTHFKPRKDLPDGSFSGWRAVRCFGPFFLDRLGASLYQDI